MANKIAIPADGDWPGLRRALAMLANNRLSSDSSQTYASVTLTDLTASRLISADADKKLVSVANLASWIAGGTGITITDDGDGTITVNTPASHDAATVADTTSINLTIAGQQISGVVLPAGVDHNSLANYAANQHFLQTDITNVSMALTTGLLKVTTGTGALSVVTDNSTNWNTAYGWGNHAGLYTPIAHKTTEDALVGLVKVDGAGNYSAVTDNSGTWNNAQPGHANLTSLAGLTFVSTSFVKMTAAGTFGLDTTTYFSTSSQVDHDATTNFVSAEHFCKQLLTMFQRVYQLDY